jgi:hypothetical protein
MMNTDLVAVFMVFKPGIIVQEVIELLNQHILFRCLEVE